MKKQQAEINVFDVKPPFCGLPEYKLNTKKYKITVDTDSRLCILNSYRKLTMAFMGVYKLKFQQFQTNDRFLIQEFIERRIQQLPLNLENIDPALYDTLTFNLNVQNKIQEPMIVYSDHITTSTPEQTDKSITGTLGITDTYNLFKLQEGCYVKIQMNIIKLTPESDDKFRGCFISVFEDESADLDQYTYSSERNRSKVSIQTYGSLELKRLTEFFCTNYIETLFKSDIVIRVDKDQSIIVFNNTPLFIVDAILCLHKDYFFTYFKSVIPTITDDYQSALIMIPITPVERGGILPNANNKQSNEPISLVQIQPQSQEDLNTQVKNAIENFISLMREFEQQVTNAILSINE